MQQMKGVSISQGLAVGKIVVLTSAAERSSERRRRRYSPSTS